MPLIPPSAGPAQTDRDAVRLDAMEARGWRTEVNPSGSWHYVGPLGIAGKPWGVGPTLRAAIDDAIAAVAAHVEDVEDETRRRVPCP